MKSRERTSGGGAIALLRSRVVRDGTSITILMVLAKLVAIGASGWAARCLGSYNLGISSLVFALTTPFLLITSFRMDVLLVRRYRGWEEAGEIAPMIDRMFTFRVVNACGVLLFVYALLYFTVGFGKDWLMTLAMAVPVLFLSVAQPYWVLQGSERLTAHYRCQFLLSVLNSALILAFFRPGMPAGSDLVVYAAALAVATAAMYRAVYGCWRFPRLRWDGYAPTWKLVRENRFILLSSLLLFAFTKLDAPLVGVLHSWAELGQYRTANILVGSAAQILIVVNQLLYPRFIAWRKEGMDVLWRRQLGIAAALLAGSVAAVAAVAWAAPLIYDVVYGDEFTAAVTPFVLLFAANCILVVSGVFTYGMWASLEDRALLVVVAPVAVVSIVLNVVYIPSHGMLGAAAVRLCSEVLILLGAGMVSYHVVRRARRRGSHPRA